MSMKYRVSILVFLICMVAVPAMTASDNYMGGTIDLGGSGVKITHTTAAATPPAIATVPPTAMPLSGSFSVTTIPAGATVFIDGVQRGISPAVIPDLPPGSHTLLLRMNGYADITVPVTITAGQTQTYTATMSSSVTQLPALPANKKTPGFGAITGIAALGTILLVRISRR